MHGALTRHSMVGSMGQVGAAADKTAMAAGRAAQVLEASVDGLGRAVAGAGAVEVRQDVTGTLAQGPPELRSSVSTAGRRG
jgi:hypothetical protein